MKTKNTLSIAAGLVFLGGLAFAFGSTEMFQGRFSAPTTDFSELLETRSDIELGVDEESYALTETNVDASLSFDLEILNGEPIQLTGNAVAIEATAYSLDSTGALVEQGSARESINSGFIFNGSLDSSATETVALSFTKSTQDLDLSSVEITVTHPDVLIEDSTDVLDTEFFEVTYEAPLGTVEIDLEMDFDDDSFAYSVEDDEVTMTYDLCYSHEFDEAYEGEYIVSSIGMDMGYEFQGGTVSEYVTFDIGTLFDGSSFEDSCMTMSYVFSLSDLDFESTISRTLTLQYPDTVELDLDSMSVSTSDVPAYDDLARSTVVDITDELEAAIAAASEEEEESEEDADEEAEGDVEYDYESVAREVLIEGYGLDEAEIEEGMLLLVEEAIATEMEEDAFLEALSEFAEEFLGEEEELEEDEEEEDEGEETLPYEELAREIVEDYGVEYGSVEEDLTELIEEASRSEMEEEEFRAEVERITEAYVASTATDGYLLSLDQVRYMEDQDVFMVNYSAVWLGSGMAMAENVELEVAWNDKETHGYSFSVAISGSGQLYELKEVRSEIGYDEEGMNEYVFTLSGSSLNFEIDNSPALEEMEEEEAVETVEVETLDEGRADVDVETIEDIAAALEELGLEESEAEAAEEELVEEETVEEEATVESTTTTTTTAEEDDSRLEALEAAIAAAEAAASSASSAASAAQSAAASASNAASSNNAVSSDTQTVNVVIEYDQPEATLVESVETVEEVVQDPNSPFKDVSSGSWYGDAMITLHDEGILEGTDGYAEPWENGNRAELIVMIVRAFYSEAELAQMSFEHQFVDVPETEWYNMHVSAAVEFNILDEKDNFYPSRNMTRAEFITSFIRAANRACVRCDVDFTDVSQGDWYYRALATAVSADLIAGFEDGTFRPDEAINRAQVAAILEKALEIEWVK